MLYMKLGGNSKEQWEFMNLNIKIKEKDAAKAELREEKERPRFFSFYYDLFCQNSLFSVPLILIFPKIEALCLGQKI